VDRPRVLIVDDLADMRDNLRELLEPEGFEVATAAGAADAEAILASGFHPDLFLIDMRLDGGDHGQDIVRRIRSDPTYGSCGIVLMSGNDFQGLLVHQYRVDAVMTKPFNSATLIAQFRGILAERGGTKHGG
jgi:CheY-like chemotaxis protein